LGGSGTFSSGATSVLVGIRIAASALRWDEMGEITVD
jgi:hypothetical protein